jgi:4-amino-4-deoxy-L-arabinose transferase-like glycosyltransferase
MDPPLTQVVPTSYDRLTESTRAKQTNLPMPERILTLLKQHRAFFIVLAFAALMFLGDIWIYKEFVRAESYFALGSRLMIEQGDWLMPHAPDELPLNKPPLTYWLIGIVYKLFGANYGSARLPSVLAALLVLAIVYALGVRLNGKRAGLISVAMLASSFLFLSFARMAMSDMLLTLCVTASLACFTLVLSNRGSLSALLGYVALALGVLAKGPVALVLVALPIGFEMGFRRSKADLKKLRLTSGLVLLGLIAAPYFLAVYARAGAAPLRFFFFGENLQRFTGQIYGASGRPVWYELAAFFGDFAPWSILVFVAIWFSWRHRGTQSGAPRLIYLWLVCSVVLFSLSSFKLDYYLLPVMPATALIIAPVIANAEKLPLAARRIVGALLIVGALMMVVVASLSLKAAAVLSILTPFRFLPVVLALAGLLAMVALMARRRTWSAALVLSAMIWASFISMQWVLLPAFVGSLPATQIAAAIPTGSVLYTSRAAGDWANCIAFNLPAPHKVERLTDDSDSQRLLATLKSNPKSVAVIREREYAPLLVADPGLRIIAEAETFGHGGLSLNMIRNPTRERLMLIGHDR